MHAAVPAGGLAALARVLTAPRSSGLSKNTARKFLARAHITNVSTPNRPACSYPYRGDVQGDSGALYQKCFQCGTAVFCSRECQKAAWFASHKIRYGMPAPVAVNPQSSRQRHAAALLDRQLDLGLLGLRLRWFLDPVTMTTPKRLPVIAGCVC